MVNGYEDVDRNMFFKLKEGNRTRGHKAALVKEQYATNHAVQEKVLLAKAAAARAAAAAANADVIRAVEQVALLEEEAATMAYNAEIAMREAEAAAVVAQQALAVAEAKRRADDEILLMEKQEAEERRRKEQDEERKMRRVEEERRRQNPNGCDEDAEREGMDPKELAAIHVSSYKVEPCDMAVSVFCLVRALPGMLVGGKDALTVTSVQQLGTLDLRHNDELVSHVFRLDGTAKDPNAKISVPLLVTIPHCAPRLASREAVIRVIGAEGRWTDYPTRDAIVEDMKELKFVETRLDTVDVTLCVITRVKQEHFVVSRRGTAVCPTVDPRVCLAYDRGTYILNTPVSLKVRPQHPGLAQGSQHPGLAQGTSATPKSRSRYVLNTPVSLKIQPVDSAAIADVKRRKLPHCEDLIACSSIVSYSSTSPNTSDNLIRVNIGLSHIAHDRQGRPRTAIIKRQEATGCPKPRPATAFGSAYNKRGEPKEVTQLLCKVPKGRWTVSDTRIVPTQKTDVLTFHVQNPMNRFMVIRTVDNPAGSNPGRIAQHLENSLNERACQLILLQKEANNNDVIVHCVSSSKTSLTMQDLAEDGYSLGPAPSAIVYLREGQTITLRFRGNIGYLDGRDAKTFVFNSNLRSCLAVQVTELNIFAQKSVDCYRGFAQVYAQSHQTRPRSGDSTLERDPDDDDDTLLCELFVQLPKPNPETLHPVIQKAPVKIRTNGVVNNDLLRHLAAELGDEWRQLAENLNVKRGRLAAILRNNVNDPDEAVYEMLVTWAKQVPLATSTIDLLCDALETVERQDLVEYTRHREMVLGRRPGTANGMTTKTR
ncbi:hypothetical protein LSAT2_018629 [Lamellibrachia satsuma]|nr:hypothetical protein LSAT2_018629 [Lamellibrachia satsuma]